MINLLALIGQALGNSVASIFWFVEEPECPKSLIK